MPKKKDDKSKKKQSGQGKKLEVSLSIGVFSKRQIDDIVKALEEMPEENGCKINFTLKTGHSYPPEILAVLEGPTEPDMVNYINNRLYKIPGIESIITAKLY